MAKGKVAAKSAPKVQKSNFFFCKIIFPVKGVKKVAPKKVVAAPAKPQTPDVSKQAAPAAPKSQEKKAPKKTAAKKAPKKANKPKKAAKKV